MSSVSELLRAIASLLWPAIVIYLLIRYRAEIPKLLKRVTHISAGNVGVDLGKAEEIRQEQKAQEAIAEALPVEVAEAPESRTVVREEEPRLTPPTAWDTDLGNRFLRAATEVERELARLTAYSRRPQSGRESLRQMAKHLPPDIRSLIDDFAPLRNRVVHMGVEPDEIEQATELAEVLLDIVRRVPVVVYPQVELYADDLGLETRRDVVGVVVETLGDEDRPERRVFPTTLKYDAGDLLVLDFDSRRSWEHTWYRDPETSDVKFAFGYSVEFTGRKR